VAELVAYVVSFFVIGVIWVNHHALFALIDRVDRVLLFENLVLLMFVVTVPFTTSALADFIPEGGSSARWAVLLYGISNIGMAFGFTAMLSRIVHRGLLVKPVPPDVGNKAILRFGLGTIAYPPDGQGSDRDEHQRGPEQAKRRGNRRTQSSDPEVSTNDAHRIALRCQGLRSVVCGRGFVHDVAKDRFAELVERIGPGPWPERASTAPGLTNCSGPVMVRSGPDEHEMPTHKGCTCVPVTA
jgi:hypothetical protein